MVLESILLRFVRLIVLFTIKLLSYHPQISNPTLEMSSHWCERMCWRSHFG